MRVFNLLVLSLALALLSTMSLCAIGEHFLGESAKFFMIAPALLIGLSSRRITEKLLGYTVQEAMKDGSNEEKK